MNAQLLGFFSGFPKRRFPEDIAKRLQQELTERDSLVFISAWPAEHESNDRDAAGMHGMFEEWDMAFARYHVIDDRTAPADAVQLIREAACIFLMGGNATQQFQLMNEKGIVDAVRRSPAVILGVSAGSINMAKYAVDIWESLMPYGGLGLADITVKAHFDLADQELVKTLQQVSMQLPVCAMEDESAIFVKGGSSTYIGKIHWIDKGMISPFSQELLAKITKEK